MGESAEPGIIALRLLPPDAASGLVTERSEVPMQAVTIHDHDSSFAGRARDVLQWYEILLSQDLRATQAQRQCDKSAKHPLKDGTCH